MYTFTNLTAGLHYVTIRPQPGWQQAGPTRQGVLVSASTNSYAGVDFGETRGGMIRGEVNRVSRDGRPPLAAGRGG